MNGTLRRVVAYTSVVAIAGAMTLPIVAGNVAANASVRPSKSLSREQMARNFISHLKMGQPAVMTSGVGKNLASINWSGYADTPPASGGSTYSAAVGDWIEPAAKCPASGGETLAAFWAGIDGFSSQTVEQDGTIVVCEEGSAEYFDWWELYPTNDIQVENAVTPGDSITSSVVRSGKNYALTVTDSTDPAASFTTTQSCTSCANSSVEWIAEAPCCKNSAGDVYNLANFGTWKLTDAAETYNGTAGNISSGPTVNRITMEDKATHVKAKPGLLTSGGTAFHDVWKRAS